jgi:hypothetical protein
MTGCELLDLMQQACRRTHVVGTPENGIICGLDLEGRLFAVLNGRVLNRVVPHAILNRSNKTEFLNPGGDALWPAPEGTCFGYEYASGDWRVPPAITGAVWEVVESAENQAVIRAEIDLINSQQLGIPCEFERHISIEYHDNRLVQNVTETIRYIGVTTLKNEEFLLAPWSLCQFNSGPGGQVIMPPPAPDDIWDLYDSSEAQRGEKDGVYIINTDTPERFQIALGKNVPWLEYICGCDFRVKRYADTLPDGQNYIDIVDAPPEQIPSDKGVKLSAYCDPSGFMEIEACGGCQEALKPGDELSVNITTEFLSIK